VTSRGDACPSCGHQRPQGRYAEMVHDSRDLLNVAWGTSDQRLKLHKTVEAVDALRRALEELNPDRSA
jgi:hypothetical protein